MRLKVCGMTLAEQVEGLMDMGVHYAGFIFYEKSPRFCLKHLRPEQIHQFHNIQKVGVFVNTEEEELLRLAEECRLDLIQLHGDETPRYCEKISGYYPVIKAFRTSDADLVQLKTQEYFEWADMYLFDTEVVGADAEGLYGGTGKRFDWHVLDEMPERKLYFLSGGIDPDCAPEIKEFMESQDRPMLHALDVNSKFETSPGIKNLEKVRKFLEAIKHF